MEFVTKVENEAVLDLLFKLAEDKKINVCDEYRRGSVNRWPCFCYSTKLTKILGTIDTSGREEVSLAEMIEIMSGKKTIAKMRLTKDYEAIVDYKTKFVTVGCQKIPFDRVDELHYLIHNQPE